jgi:hypothetical protein
VIISAFPERVMRRIFESKRDDVTDDWGNYIFRS